MQTNANDMSNFVKRKFVENLFDNAFLCGQHYHKILYKLTLLFASKRMQFLIEPLSFAQSILHRQTSKKSVDPFRPFGLP